MKHLYLQNVVASKRHQLIESPPGMQKTQIPCLNETATVDTPNYKHLYYLLICHRIFWGKYTKDKSMISSQPLSSSSLDSGISKSQNHLYTVEYHIFSIIPAILLEYLKHE